MKEQTNVLIEKDLKNEAQASGIKLGRALEEYLEMLLHKGGLIARYEKKKEFHLAKAKEYREKIKELEKRLEREEEIRGDIDSRMEKAIDIALTVYENEVGLTDDRIREIAEQQIVPAIDLIDEVKKKITQKKG